MLILLHQITSSKPFIDDNVIFDALKVNGRIGFTIASKINVTPKGDYLPISKLHSILAVANLLAHNNKSQICYCGQISLQSAAVNCSFSDTFGGNIMGLVWKQASTLFL